MTVVAWIRPDSINVALLLHVGGALIMVGGIVTAATALLVGFRAGGESLLRLGYRTLLAVALPGAVLMRIGAQWTESRENITGDPTWILFGYTLGDGGIVLLLVALILGGFGVRRLRDGRGAGLLKATSAISLLLVVAFAVTIWAMGAKPD
jgi:hypothetical protein